MDYQAFIQAQIAAIGASVGDGRAINALSGGVDSSVVTALGHRALGDRLRTIFVDNALMRDGEPARVVEMFSKMNIPVEIIDARADFLDALRGLTDPEEKRNAITHTFYSKVFGRIVRESGATHLLHGTILTDIEETVDGIKRQHNILSQLGIDPEKEYGYQVLEPLASLRKDGVREAARVLGFSANVAQRMPFPGPALATRIVGEVTVARLETVRTATAIVEEEL
ncbi:MAG: glutamine-hydrolyzing GMP synthase, partial [Pirellulaceae bacterium]